MTEGVVCQENPAPKVDSMYNKLAGPYCQPY